jgi:hypothetical protein
MIRNSGATSGSFWKTLPGILTALAGLITAIGGLIVVLNQTGIFTPETQGSASNGAADASGGSFSSSQESGSPAADSSAETDDVEDEKVPIPEPIPSGTKEVWLIIDGLEFFSAFEHTEVQVLANVNGTEFIYPSRGGVEWLEVGPSMSPQVFRLPPARDRYVVRFEAKVRVGEGGSPEIRGELKSVTEHVIDVATDIPFTGRYILHTFDPIHRSRSARAEAELLYRITNDPQ